jgi:hypothetical protein
VAGACPSGSRGTTSGGITDASVKLLAEMKSLTGVDLKDTRVTENGVAELKTARPHLYIRR